MQLCYGRMSKRLILSGICIYTFSAIKSNTKSLLCSNFIVTSFHQWNFLSLLLVKLIHLYPSSILFSILTTLCLLYNQIVVWLDIFKIYWGISDVVYMCEIIWLLLYCWCLFSHSAFDKAKDFSISSSIPPLYIQYGNSIDQINVIYREKYWRIEYFINIGKIENISYQWWFTVVIKVNNQHHSWMFINH